MKTIHLSMFKDMEIESLTKQLESLTKQLQPWDPKTSGVKLHARNCVPYPDNVLVNAINPDMRFGPWIAGGAVIQWYQDRPVTIIDEIGRPKNTDMLRDVDVFVASDVQFQKVIDSLQTSFSTTRTFTSENADTFICRSAYYTWKVQVIRHKHKTVDDLLAAFDITCCQIATDGDSFKYIGTAAADITNKTIKLTDRRKAGTMNRVIKYISYGYTPAPETYDVLYGTNVSDLVNENQTDYENIVS